MIQGYTFAVIILIYRSSYYIVSIYNLKFIDDHDFVIFNPTWLGWCSAMVQV